MKQITDSQIRVLNLLLSGQSLAQVAIACGLSLSATKRLKAKFAGILSERDEALLQAVVEARSQSFELLSETLTALQEMLRSADSVDERLAVVDRSLRAFSLLNPSIATPAIAPKAEEQSPQVVVYIPDNGRD